MAALSAAPEESTPSNGSAADLQPADVLLAAQSSYETLHPASGADWSVPAADLEWDCRETLEHTLGAVDNYCRHLAIPTSEPHPRLTVSYAGTPLENVIAGLRLRAGILAALAGASAPTVRGFHVFGRPDPAGYVGMGCVEIILHTDDIARALGVPYTPPMDPTAKALARLFPWAPTDVDAWTALRWVTGRLELPGRGRVAPNWAWHASPVSEWDGEAKTRESYT